MSFKAVWGFDPDEVEKAKQLRKVTHDVPGEVAQERTDEDLAGSDCAGIPSSFEAQVYELRRMFRL